MPKATPLKAGLRYGFLTVRNSEFCETRRRVMWNCECDCGNVVSVRANSLTSGNTISCGCQRGKNTKHGGKGSPEYEAFCAAKGRCERPTQQQFRNYGGRGIKFQFASYDQFLAHIGPRPSPEHSLDRIDNDGHYAPGNVRWSTIETQANNRRTNVPVTHNGETRTLAQWADHLGLSRATIKARHRKGYPVEKLLGVTQNVAQMKNKKAAND